MAEQWAVHGMVRDDGDAPFYNGFALYRIIDNPPSVKEFVSVYNDDHTLAMQQRLYKALLAFKEAMEESADG